MCDHRTRIALCVMRLHLCWIGIGVGVGSAGHAWSSRYPLAEVEIEQMQHKADERVQLVHTCTHPMNECNRQQRQSTEAKVPMLTPIAAPLEPMPSTSFGESAREWGRWYWVY